jgi:ribosome modulation factor
MQNEAFNEGYKAFHNGLDHTCNPYTNNPFCVFNSEWSKGWTSAFVENELFS